MSSSSTLQAGATLAATELGAQYAIGRYAQVPDQVWYLLAVGGYVAVAMLQMAYTSDGGSLALNNAAWNAFSNIAVALMSVTFLGDSLNSTQWLGIAVASVGIYIMAS
jgi:drug/metabolite transporter (DMT)-like permease